MHRWRCGAVVAAIVDRPVHYYTVQKKGRNQRRDNGALTAGKKIVNLVFCSRHCGCTMFPLPLPLQGTSSPSDPLPPPTHMVDRETACFVVGYILLAAGLSHGLCAEFRQWREQRQQRQRKKNRSHRCSRVAWVGRKYHLLLCNS